MAIFKTVLTSMALIALAAQTTSATPLDSTKAKTLKARDGCFSGGESYVDAGFPNTNWIAGACSKVTGKAIDPSSTKSICIPSEDGADARINFSVENTSSSESTLAQDAYLINFSELPPPFFFLEQTTNSSRLCY